MTCLYNMRILGLCSVLLLAASSSAYGEDRTVNLAGQWRVSLDAQDHGETKRWFDSLPNDAAAIELPGSIQEQGLGDDIHINTPWTGGLNDPSWRTEKKFEPYRQPDNIKVPFWLQPEKYYVGAAWFERRFITPDQWNGKRITLHLERCHWETTVWVDGVKVGRRNSLLTPHEYDLTQYATPGEHRLTIRVDNRVKIKVGFDAHSVSDHTQSNWNGIVGDIRLNATEAIRIEDVRIDPNVDNQSAKIKIKAANFTAKGADVMLVVDAAAHNTDQPHHPARVEQSIELDANSTSTIELDYPMGPDVQQWDEFHPAMYRLTVQLQTKDGRRDDRTVDFGMRQIAVEDGRITLNGRPVMFRGTLECNIFPLTGYPPTDVESWRRIIRICQAHGLNHIRFHSHCPPQAAFVAADELGFYFQVECGVWTAMGNGGAVDQWVPDEADRILQTYGNHPSFVLMAHGNEPGGKNHPAYLGELVEKWKLADSRRLYTAAAGWPLIEQNQFHSSHLPRVQRWGAGLNSRINSKDPETITDYRDFVAQYAAPVISHEIGQWCVYPDFDEIPKYTGVLKPKNFEIFRDFLERNHMGDQARDFFMASGKLQIIVYKEDVESALRTEKFGGFQLLDLHDFPGQGTALVGLLDPFWNSKPYCSPQEFSRFCNSTVPLALMSKRILTNDQTFHAQLKVSHFGPADLSNAVLYWRLEDSSGSVIAKKQINVPMIRTGGLTAAGEVSAPLNKLANAQQLKLIVGIEGTRFENDWDIWVYPKQVELDAPNDVLVVNEWNSPAVDRLKQGGDVLLLADPSKVKTSVAIGFSPVFWNTSWTRGQPPHTLGLLCDPNHPALKGFPTAEHSNWQWQPLIRRSAAMVLDGLPAELRPIVQPIDTWFEARRLGLIVEAKVQTGRLLICSINLTDDLGHRPVARQLRQALMSYLSSNDFNPSVELTLPQIAELFKQPSYLQQIKATVQADSAAANHPPIHVIDNNPATHWHTPWGDSEPAHPHALTIDLLTAQRISGLRLLGRSDSANGRFNEIEIHLSKDGREWGDPIARAKLKNNAEWQTVAWRDQEARYIRVKVLSGVNGLPFASLAEVDVIQNEQEK